MIFGLDTKDKAYYNLRKRFGRDLARSIIKYWNHFHIYSPESSDEALLYFIGVIN